MKRNNFDINFGRSTRRNNTRIFGVFAVIICLLGFFLSNAKDKKSTNLSTAEVNVNYEYAASLIASGDGPENGTIFYRKYKTNPAFLHIVNRSKADACIQCTDGLLNNGVIQFYVRAENEVTIKVPVGYFELHFAIGENWIDQNNLFGETTVFFSDSSRYGQEFSRKKICEFTIEPSVSNLVPIEKSRY